MAENADDKISNGYIEVIEGLYQKMAADRQKYEEAVKAEEATYKGYEEAYEMIKERDKEIEKLKALISVLKQEPVEAVWGKAGEWSIYKQPTASIPYVNKD